MFQEQELPQTTPSGTVCPNRPFLLVPVWYCYHSDANGPKGWSSTTKRIGKDLPSSLPTGQEAKDGVGKDDSEESLPHSECPMEAATF